MLRTYAAAKEWLTEKDAMRLDMANLPRPNTKWVFQRWVQVEVKAILVEQPLLGQGLLPDWLRNKKGLYALDTFDDNIDGLLYNYRISCFTNFTGDEKNCLVK